MTSRISSEFSISSSAAESLNHPLLNQRGIMIRIQFTEEEKQALNYERYHYPHPRVQRKMEALWLKS